MGNSSFLEIKRQRSPLNPVGMPAHFRKEVRGPGDGRPATEEKVDWSLDLFTVFASASARPTSVVHLRRQHVGVVIPPRLASSRCLPLVSSHEGAPCLHLGMSAAWAGDGEGRIRIRMPMRARTRARSGTCQLVIPTPPGLYCSFAYGSIRCGIAITQVSTSAMLAGQTYLALESNQHTLLCLQTCSLRLLSYIYRRIRSRSVRFFHVSSSGPAEKVDAGQGHMCPLHTWLRMHHYKSIKLIGLMPSRSS